MVRSLLVQGQGVGGRDGEGPKASWSQAVPQRAVIGPGPCYHLQLWVPGNDVHLLQFMSELSPYMKKDLGSFLVTSLLLCYLLRGLSPKSGSL